MDTILTSINQNRKNALNINNSIWVAASAGSGKTTILVDRLLSLFINNVDISKIICITFTKTAAHEMKERIYNKLAKWTIMDDDTLKGEIKRVIGLNNNEIVPENLLKQSKTLFARLIDNIDDLKIFTIHSFCQQIISRFPIEAGILPNFEVIEGYKVNELVQKSIEETFENIEKNSEVYPYIKNLILDNSEDNFYELINYLIEKRKIFEYIKEYDYENDLKKLFKIYHKNKDEILNNFLNYDFSNIQELVEFIENGKDFTDNQRKNFESVATFLNNKNNITDKENIVLEYVNVFLTSEFKKRNFSAKNNNIIKKINNDFLKNILLEEQDRCYELMQNLDNFKYFELSLSIIKVNLKIIDNYKKLKENNSYLDFDDLITITLKLLQNTEYSAWVNFKLDNGIEHVLVDEAQDTSNLQWEIIKSITGDFFSGETKNENERTLFVVGDEKQSIYSFQDADPDIFNEKYEFYKELIEESGKIFCKVNLQCSFRSLNSILKFVDAVFQDKIYSQKISKQDDKIVHNNIRTGLGLVELWPQLSVKNEKQDSWGLNFDNTIEIKNFELLASKIVEKIGDLLNSNRAIIDRTGEKRKIKYSDIMILVKTRNKILLSYLIRQLNRKNIPNSGYDRLNLFDNIIIQDFIALFKFILFQNDDLSLANLIKSPFLNLKEEDLYELCKKKEEDKITLFEVLKNTEKYKEQYDFLINVIEKSKILNIYDLCFYILENCNIRLKIIERFDKNINIILNNFLDFIKNYEKDNITTTLLSFLYFLENNKNEIKKDLDNAENQVKIMTIHSSKGMQAPIVFIADCNTGIAENQDKLFFYDEYGYRLPIYKKSSKSELIKEIKDNNGYKIHAEYFRLFYVAITRAENELYLCSTGIEKNEEKEEKKNTWYDISKNAMLYLGAEEKPFDLDRTKNKFSYGGENYITTKNIDINQEQTIKNNIIKQNLKEILEYKIEENSTEKVITPSQFYSHTDKDDLYTKLNLKIIIGNAIHKLLEILPNTTIEEREKIADICLENSFYNLEKIEKDKIKMKVFDILKNEKYKKFFSNNSKSEVEIVGKVEYEGKEIMVSGKIDRLAEYEDKILILDYKNTSKHYTKLNELPKNYLKQLELYKKLVKKIYVGKLVECYILITTWGELIKI